MNQSEEKIIFCSYCGCANERAPICAGCGRDIYAKRSPFLHFLAKHTKDKFKSELEDNVFEAIYKFLLSHLYGIIMTVAFITSAAVLVSGYSVPSYITEVSGGVNAIPGHNGPVVTLLSDKEYKEIRELCSDYTSLSDKKLGVPYIIDDTESPASFLAESTGKFPYLGEHHVMENGLATVLSWDVEGTRPGSWTDSGPFLVNEQLTNELAITLRDAGYRVTENIKDYKGYNQVNPEKLSWGELPEPPDFARHVQYVYVEIDGKWYIAEDLIFEGAAP